MVIHKCKLLFFSFPDRSARSMGDFVAAHDGECRIGGNRVHAAPIAVANNTDDPAESIIRKHLSYDMARKEARKEIKGYPAPPSLLRIT